MLVRPQGINLQDICVVLELLTVVRCRDFGVTVDCQARFTQTSELLMHCTWSWEQACGLRVRICLHCSMFKMALCKGSSYKIYNSRNCIILQ